uniref:Immunoglobulin V-set domain-containing protein n=1 Tax=Seriola lalandi dorsalis TaxID=1841481 RepID=A0A3B4XBP5_SERLL
IKPKNPSVHSFYYNTDQLAHQDQRYRGRTSLFKDQISRGNASLQLTGAKLQDQGRYKCYTSTLSGNQELFSNLKVEGTRNKQ